MVAHVEGPRQPPRTHVPPPQAFREGLRPWGSPGCATHGVAADPPARGCRVDVPVVSGSRMFSVPAGFPGSGGQSLESGNVLFAAVESATATMPSTVHVLPAFGPTSHRPPRHFGQTCSSSLRYTRENRSISPSI